MTQLDVQLDVTPPPLGAPTDEAAPTLRAEMGRLFKLALPNIGSNITRILMGFADFAMVSQLGTEAQAAISPATMSTWAVFCVGSGVAISITTFAAQSLGRGERREAAAYGWQAFYVAALFSLLIVPAQMLVVPFYRAVGHAPAVFAAEVSYTRLCLYGLGGTVLTFGLDGFFSGVQRPGVSLWAAIVGLITNIGLNYVLIFGHFGAPRMGVAGAALATAIGWWARAGLLAIVFLSPRFARDFGTRDVWRPSWRKISGMLHVGGPTSATWVLDVAAWAFFMTALVGQFGTSALAASNIGVQYTYVAFMPAVGIGMALTSLVGHAIGAGRPEWAVLRTRAAMYMIAAYMGAIGLVFWLARVPLVRLFNDNPEVLALGGSVMIWCAAFQLFDAMSITFSSALRGAGDTRVPGLYILAYSWGVFVGGGWCIARLAPQLNLNGPWCMATTYIMLIGLTLWWRFHRGAWRKIRLIRPSGGS